MFVYVVDRLVHQVLKRHGVLPAVVTDKDLRICLLDRIRFDLYMYVLAYQGFRLSFEVNLDVIAVPTALRFLPLCVNNRLVLCFNFSTNTAGCL